jgi:hypothetical protein
MDAKGDTEEERSKDYSFSRRLGAHRSDHRKGSLVWKMPEVTSAAGSWNKLSENMSASCGQISEPKHLAAKLLLE